MKRIIPINKAMTRVIVFLCGITLLIGDNKTVILPLQLSFSFMGRGCPPLSTQSNGLLTRLHATVMFSSLFI